MSDSRIATRSVTPEAELITTVYNPKKRISTNLQPTGDDQRYNDIVTAIIHQKNQDDSRQKVRFRAKWYRFTSNDGPKYTREEDREFVLDQEQLDHLLRNVHSTAEIMSKIADLATLQHPGKSDQYKETHDQYLRILLEFHDTVSSQAAIVLEILNEIESKRDQIRKSKDVIVYSAGDKVATTCIKPEDCFPDDTTLKISKDDMEIIRQMFQRHRQLYTYIAGIRVEILNCLADNRAFSTAAQVHTLQSLSATLGLSLKIDRQALLRASETAYSIVDDVESFDESGCPLTTSQKWCHVSKRFWDPGVVKNAHIIPAATEPGSIRNIFGDPEPARILNSPRNFLFMYQSIEKAFDEGRISIVPVDLAETKRNENLVAMDFRILFIDRSLIHSRKVVSSQGKNRVLSWYDIAQSPVLGFKNTFRPGLRNLFWHCISSLTKAKQESFPGYVQALDEFESIWKNTGLNSWISKPILLGLSEAFRMPEIGKINVFLDETEVQRLNELYTIAKLPWLPSQQREDVDLDPEELSREYTFPFMGPQQFASPRIVRLFENVEADIGNEHR